MKVDTAFRLSTYLTVAVASGCLTYAEAPYLPGLTFLAIPLGVLLVVAFFLEGAWSLSAGGANGLGLLVAVGWVGWVVLFSDEFDDPLGRPPWPAVFLPYLGPLLMLLLLIKLFRPKDIRDYWYLHSIGLIEVVVGAVLVVESYFGAMLLGYVLCAFWSMTLFYMFREQEKAKPGVRKREEGRGRREEISRAAYSSLILHPSSLSPTPDSKVSWRHLGFWPAARRTLAVTLVTLSLFLLTPQQGSTDAVFFLLDRTSRGQTGFANSPMDLTTTGRIEVDDSVAFEVYAENADGTPKKDLSPTIRWRGMVMDHYALGRWMHPGHQLTFVPRGSRTQLPDLGSDQFFITYRIHTKQSHGLFLAEPIIVSVDRQPGLMKMPEAWMPYVSLTLQGTPIVGHSLFNYQDREDVVVGVVPLEPIRVTYQQVTRPASRDGLSQPLSLKDTDKTFLTDQLLDQPVSGIRKWTKELLDRWTQEKKVDPEDVKKKVLVRPGKSLRCLAPESRERVARALVDYLALSGEYDYSLSLERQDRQLDPTEDFLRNVKQGHCQRFATALVLMLRSAGIPARLVVGFRGAEAKSALEPDNGWYIIRQSHAHAWVEALVGQKNAEGKTELRWLTLDPSPLQEADDAGSLTFSQWWDRSLQFLRNFWRVYILEYNTQQQGEVVQTLWRHGAAHAISGYQWIQREPYWLAGLTALLVGVIWLRRPKIRRHPPPTIHHSPAFYYRLLKLLKRSGRLVPRVGQTPQEFAANAQDFLATRGIETDLIKLPVRIVELFYQVRYGQMTISPAERHQIDRQLARLSAALNKSSTVTT
jgi:transglutaminase-like putative cysteine protease